MHKFICLLRIFFITGLILGPTQQAHAAYPWYIDGRTTPIYYDTLQTYSDNVTVVGNVYYKSGIDIAAGKVIELGIVPVLRGNINLNITGTLRLLDSLHVELASNIGFTGGFINNTIAFKTLFFDNEVILTNAIKITGTYLYIDMQGNALGFNPLSNVGNGWSDARGIINMTDQSILIKNANIIYPSDLTFQGIGYNYSVPVFRLQSPSVGPNGIFNFTNVAFYLDGTTTFTTPAFFQPYDSIQFFSNGTSMKYFIIGGQSAIQGSSRASELYINENIVLSFQNIPSTQFPQFITFAFNNGNLSTSSNYSFAQSSVFIDGRVEFSTTTKGTKITFGDGTLANDTNVVIAPGATLVVDDDVTLEYRNVD